MDGNMTQLQRTMMEVEVEAEQFLLARHQLVENDRLRNGNQNAQRALRKRAGTTRTSVTSPYGSIMKDVRGPGSKPLVKEVCEICGNHDSKEKTWMMFPGTDIFVKMPFDAAHTILEKDLLANLKRQKGEDSLKGQAVKNQKTLWNKSLELRFLLQKPFSSSNRLPQEPARSLFVESDEGVSEAYTELIKSSEKTIDSLLELQNALLENNPFIPQATDGNSHSSKKPDHDDMNSKTDDKWKLISEMQSRMVIFRDRSIDKWLRKTQVTTGVASIKGRYQAFNQNISQQVSAYMRDPSRMIKQIQARRSTVSVFGAVPEEIGNVKEEDADGDPDLLDDGELYQQLLKEFFETFDPSATEAALYNLKRSQAKKRKIVDRRASKSRKIRYTVHEKIVNFMAPEPANIPPMAPKLFENLFGIKSRIPASN